MSLRIITANTDWAKRGDADYIALLCKTADVVLTQESKDTDLAAVAPEGWTALQDTTDDAHKGTGILVREAAAKIHRHEVVLGVKPFLPTGKRVRMLARYINVAHLTDLSSDLPLVVVSAHFPPARFSPLQIPFRRRLRRAIAGLHHVVIGTDANQPIGNVAKALGYAAHGTGIVGLLTNPGIKVSHFAVSGRGERLGYTDHPSVSATVESVTPRALAPAPYGKTTVRDGKTLDNLTDYALLAVEKRLGYNPRSLTIVQGSYNAGGVSASAGTHDGGGAVDLTPQNWEQKVHALRAVGFAAWHRPAIPGLWAEHVHCILIGNAKLSPAAAAQVVDYRNHRDGLADHAADNTWHPNPIPTFHMPKYAE